MSTLHALLVFAGIPLLAVVGISLLVMVPSLAKGPRYRLGQDWNAEPEHFGVLPLGNDGPDEGRRLEAAPGQRAQATDPSSDREASSDDDAGGASVSW